MEMARNKQRENSGKSLPFCEQICQTYTSQSFKTENFYSFRVIAHEREKTLCLSPIFHFWPEIMGQDFSKICNSIINVELHRETHPKPIATQ